MGKKLSLTIGIPTYNGTPWIKQTLKSIFSQNFQNFEIIVSDDCSKDQTVNIIRKFKDKRIKIYQNKKNLGYGKNLQVLKKHTQGEILFLMAQDDILLKDALSKTYKAFLKSKQVGAVTRPYYWFDESPQKPVRALPPFDRQKDRIISIFDGEKEVKKIFQSVGQLSGLAYRTKYMDRGFHSETFTAHLYPFASIIKKYKVVFLKDYMVAVRIRSSQTRHLSKIYDISPVESWVKMFKSVYAEKKYEKVRRAGIKQITTHFLGLAQIKNFSNFKNLIKEVCLLVKFNPKNLINPKFWLFSLGVMLIPRKILLCLVDNYKNKVLSKKLQNIKSDV